jgi:hypothetical protein
MKLLTLRNSIKRTMIKWKNLYSITSSDRLPSVFSIRTGLPVPFFLNIVVSGLRAPLGAPKIAEAAV